MVDFVMRNNLFVILCDDADEPKETEVEDALKTVGSSDFLKEPTTSTKGTFKKIILSHVIFTKKVNINTYHSN